MPEPIFESDPIALVRVSDALDAVAKRLDAAEVHFGHGSDSAWDEAVLLVLSAAGIPAHADETVLTQVLTDETRARIEVLTQRRIDERKPLAYLLGRAWFADLELYCDERALVPRSPLAEVIRHAYTPWWQGPAPSRLLDLCCGGGAIGIAAAVYEPSLSVVLADVSPEALELARANVDKHRLGERVQIAYSNLFDNLQGQVFDLILSNPPYVNAADLASMPEEFHAEPPLGLGSGHDGLDLARRILAEAADHLSPAGLLFLELGNSWAALDELLADLPLTWIELADGGQGVLVMSRDELRALDTRLLASS